MFPPTTACLISLALAKKKRGVFFSCKICEDPYCGDRFVKRGVGFSALVLPVMSSGTLLVSNQLSFGSWEISSKFKIYMRYTVKAVDLIPCYRSQRSVSLALTRGTRSDSKLYTQLFWLISNISMSLDVYRYIRSDITTSHLRHIPLSAWFPSVKFRSPVGVLIVIK